MMLPGAVFFSHGSRAAKSKRAAWANLPCAKQAVTPLRDRPRKKKVAMNKEGDRGEGLPDTAFEGRGKGNK
jgi:hypothetical protein